VVYKIPLKKLAFEKGEFSIRQASDSFNGILSDMGTEKTHHKRFEGLRWYRRNNASEICPC
jgi:hypothetical protein